MSETNEAKRIYRSWEDYWQNGNHGFSSASRECAKEIWDDFEPTIKATLDDHKKAYIVLTNEQLAFRGECFSAALDYIELYKKPDAPKFWRWLLDRTSNDRNE